MPRSTQRNVTIFLLLTLVIPTFTVQAYCDTENEKPRLFEIVVSPRLSPAQADVAWKATLGILEHRLCKAGDTLLLTDSDTLQRVVSLRLGDRIMSCDQKYLKWKITMHKNDIARLNAFFTGIKERGNTETADLDIPSVLNVIGQRQAQFRDYNRDVVLFGSAIHVDRRGKGYSTEKTFPSDGHLFDPTSVFTVRGREGRLQGTSVHLVHTNDFLNDLHRDRLGRFWTLYVEQQGGKLVTYTVDGNVQERLTVPPLPPLTAQLNEADARPAMYLAERLTIDMWGDIPQKAPPSTDHVNTLMIGIKWSDCSSCDFDVYAGMKDGDVRLSYKRPSAPFGIHVKDFRTGGSNEYERIEFNRKVDIRDVEAAINFYGGRSRTFPAKGEVRVVFGGQVYSAPFAIQSQTGNGGREDEENYWTEIDLASIVGMFDKDAQGTP